MPLLELGRHRRRSTRRKTDSAYRYLPSELGSADGDVPVMRRCGRSGGGARRPADVRRYAADGGMTGREVGASFLEQQIGRTINPDRKARLQFVVSALSSDPAERDRFFASLADVTNRRHEPWVLDGLRYVHHPLRAASAVKYIDPSLKLLQEIQQTGDIFLPMRWIVETLGGHRSPDAAAIVRA